MPVTITQNNDGSMKITGKVSKTQKISPKFFNATLTGSSQSATRGYFNAASHTFEHKAQENMVIPDDQLAAFQNRIAYRSANYATNAYVDNTNYVFVEATPVQLVPTFYQIGNTDDIPFYGTDLSKETSQSNFNRIDKWSKVYECSDFTVYASIDILQIGEFRVKDKTGTNQKQFDYLTQSNMAIITGDLDDVTSIRYVSDDSVTITANNEVRYPLNRKFSDNTTALIVSAPTATRLMQIMSTSHVDKQLFNASLESLEATQSVYSNILYHADKLSTDRVKQLTEFFDIVHANHTNMTEKQLFNILKRTMTHVNYFDKKDKSFFTISDMTDIYEQLLRFKPLLSNAYFEHLLKQNIRVLLASNISKLRTNKPNLYKPDTTTPEWQATEAKWQTNPDYSPQQRAIILSKEPLIIAQAGAGSGKSHTVVGRLSYLQEQKENLNNALVLSFTNAAADNIKDRFPDIQSETLARMFDNIYRETYPSQELVSIETLHNTLKLLDLSSNVFQNIVSDEDPNKYYTQDQLDGIIDVFKTITKNYVQSQISFKKIDHNELSAKLIALVAKYKNAIEAILNAIGQTTLELEPVMIHHHLANGGGQLSIPKEYSQINYIITDESQDISTFEYNLLLEFVNENKAQLLIVGDGSQTLYEFRSSDPRYMNALEASQVFTTYKLETNYRSKQAILSYANEFLKVISANDIAQIQLQSNDKTPLTWADYKKAVEIQDINVRGTSDYNDALKGVFQYDKVKNYVLTKLKNGEQVALVGYTRQELMIIRQALEQLLADNNLNIPITSLVQDKAGIAAIWTTALARGNNDLKTLAVTPTINNDIRRILLDAVDNSYRSRSQKQRAFYQSKMNETLDQLFVSPQWIYLKNQLLARKIKVSNLRSYLYGYMVRVEKREISASNYLQSKETPNVKDAQIVLSTIHRVKGFEFDNVVVFHNAFKTKSAQGSNLQELFRMYFVALSRAKNSELIVNVGPMQKVISEHTMFEYPMETANLLLKQELQP